MATRDLYLYEVIDIVGQGQYEYMEHLWRDPVQDMPEMDKLQGSFYVCAFGGGRWPQVINIWDVGTEGWTGWAKNVDRLNLKRRAPSTANGGTRRPSGGRVASTGSVAASPGARTPRRLIERGVKGTLFVNEILDVRRRRGVGLPRRGGRAAGAVDARVRARTDGDLRGDVESA